MRSTVSSIPPIDHRQYLILALDEARKSPPKPTNFCVGACIVDPSTSPTPTVLCTGYTLELEGNTHAEQNCFSKLASIYGCTVSEIGWHLSSDAILYTTLEPCNKRSIGNMACVDRILRVKGREGEQVLKRIVVGVQEPETFVGKNEGMEKLREADVEVVLAEGLQEEILRVATAGHI
ncbi:hypothetical protein K431DRAFT_227026 [Polychaeton citri CBS 116435]|uniref:CMP/dCMP-type deaminase domain-containing protein n=1 Tax=Polychaeton citri CBS 116435 TaxID=1314669 RepID=A0A9P4Q6E7_9PEZI|nr:hypothetical protein K431DRAFT_227026 [Polychaeton citri CBS 116435]